MDSGKTKEQAVIRACHEELAITAAPANIFSDVVHEFIHLTLFNCTIEKEISPLLARNDLIWITPIAI